MKSIWRAIASDTRLIALAVLAGLGLIYLPTLSHAFVWDDLTFVSALWPLRDPASWWTAVQQPFPIAPVYYRPLGVLFLTTEFSLAGRAPALFHLVSIVLHVLNTALVAWLARLAWPDRRAAPIVALVVYGLHPALIEGVAFISSQFDLLLTTCLLLALVADARIQRPGRRAVVIGGLFLLAALIKEMAIVLVLVLPIWQVSRDGSPDAWRSRWHDRRPTYLAVIGAGVIYLVLRVSSLGHLLPLSSSQVPGGDVLQHLLLVARSLVEYLLVIIWPFGTLRPIHYGALPVATDDGLAWLAVAMGLALVGALVYRVRHTPRSGWLAVAAVAALMPVLNIIPLDLTGGAFVAERFLVFPLTLLALAISGPLTKWLSTSRRAGRTVLVGLWCVASVVTNTLTVPKWADGLSLWTWASERAPQSWSAWSGLAYESNQRGDYEAGLLMAQRAIALNAADEFGWSNAGRALVGLGRYDEALVQFEHATQLAPTNALFWNNLGGVFLYQGRWPEAEQSLLRALALDPKEPLTRLNLGRIYLNMERPDLALPHLQAAVPLLPADLATQARALLDQANQPDMWLRLTDHWLNQGDPTDAAQALVEAERRGADVIEVAVGRCSILTAQARLTEAAAACQAVIDRAPGEARAYNNLGVIAQRQGDVTAARELFQRAIDLQPEWNLPRQNLAKLPAP